MKGRWLRLAPIVQGELWAVVDPEDIMTAMIAYPGRRGFGFRASVVVQNPVTRLIEEIDPPGTAVGLGESYRLMPDSERKILAAVAKNYPYGFPPEPDDADRNWLGERFIKMHLVFHHEDHGVGGGELTLGAVRAEVDGYEPPYDTEEEERRAVDNIRTYLDGLVRQHGAEQPARFCIG
jgi:hypothetical protein